MSSAMEGLRAIIRVAPAGGVALLTGVELSWTQSNKRFRPCGTLTTTQVLRGVTDWEGSFRKAFYQIPHLGSFNVGTLEHLGTIFPRGGTNPLIAGTFCFNGGSLTNMNAADETEVTEENTFIVYNLTFTD